MDVTHMDPQTAKLAIELQLDDINDLLDGLYDDELPAGDPRIGFEQMRQDLQRQLQTLEGQVLTLKILKEEHNNRVAFARLREEERQAEEDHRLALRFARLNDEDSDISSKSDMDAGLQEIHENDIVDVQWRMAKELYVSAFKDGALTLDTSSAGGADSEDLSNSEFSTCSVCIEVVGAKDTLQLQCQPERHTYCRWCLIELFKTAVADTTLFPPRCCKVAIPLGICRALLPQELIENFDLKVEELACPNPTYCANPECAKFIPLRDIDGDIGNCQFCDESTCVQCKYQKHAGLCPSDPHVQLLMDVAKRSNWQLCSKCGNMVELDVGCFHMTCRCKHEFCYLCGKAWKGCKCPRWNEAYLTRNQPGAHHQAPNQVPAQVQAPAPAARNLATCDHQLRRLSGGICQHCGADWLKWTIRCTRCDYSTCWRCRNNRG